MSRRQDIITRANEELQRVIDHCTSVRTEIERQQRAALSTLPGLAAALTAYDAAMRGAFDRYRARLDDLATTLGHAEGEALQSHADSEGEAMAGWQAAIQAAEDARAAAWQSARLAYERAYDEARTTVGPAGDGKRVTAQRERDRAEREADRVARRALDVAYREYQRGSQAAHQASVLAFERARADHDGHARQAAADLDRAQREALDGWAAACRGVPEAAPVQEAYGMQLAQAATDCEGRKSDVLARMERDLADAT